MENLAAYRVPVYTGLFTYKPYYENNPYALVFPDGVNDGAVVYLFSSGQNNKPWQWVAKKAHIDGANFSFGEGEYYSFRGTLNTSDARLQMYNLAGKACGDAIVLARKLSDDTSELESKHLASFLYFI
jgi:hypothetical protein